MGKETTNAITNMNYFAIKIYTSPFHYKNLFRKNHANARTYRNQF